jgi:ketosteroid isomerase-like protein
MCDAYARRDWEAAAEPLDERIEWDAATYSAWPDAEVFRGKQGVLDFFRRFLGTWDEYKVDFEEFIDCGDDVVVRVWDRARGKGSGVEVERRWAQRWTVRDGKVVFFRGYQDLESALAEARSDAGAVEPAD